MKIKKLITEWIENGAVEDTQKIVNYNDNNSINITIPADLYFKIVGYLCSIQNNGLQIINKEDGTITIKKV